MNKSVLNHQSAHMNPSAQVLILHEQLALKRIKELEMQAIERELSEIRLILKENGWVESKRVLKIRQALKFAAQALFGFLSQGKMVREVGPGMRPQSEHEWKYHNFPPIHRI